MARKFSDAGLPSVALTGDDDPELRTQRLKDLQSGRLRCIFSVEVLGEGVDVPDVDCIVLLRPRSSATLFAQQLGRGLRRAEGKSHLTVIDLIGQHRREFRFDDRLSAILDRRRGAVDKQVEDDFPFLPAGCTVDLDRQSREIVLDNLRAAVRRSRWTTLVSDLRAMPDGTGLMEFPDANACRLEDLYRAHSWTELQRAAGKPIAQTADEPFEATSLKALGRLTHLDDPERVTFYRNLIARPEPPRMAQFGPREQRLVTMLAWGMGSGQVGSPNLDTYLERLWAEVATRNEFLQLLQVLDERSRTRPSVSPLPPEIPLTVHARYSRAEIIAALGFGEGVSPKVTQGGILWVEQAASDVFFVDLHKAERDYSPTTMYRDYAINRDLFHWESQSRQTPSQPSVQRYINHQERRSNVLLFVREHKTLELGTMPFTFLGPVTYVEHRGERPVSFTWQLATPMPEELFEIARSVAAA